MTCLTVKLFLFALICTKVPNTQNALYTLTLSHLVCVCVCVSVVALQSFFLSLFLSLSLSSAYLTFFARSLALYFAFRSSFVCDAFLMNNRIGGIPGEMVWKVQRTVYFFKRAPLTSNVAEQRISNRHEHSWMQRERGRDIAQGLQLLDF